MRKKISAELKAKIAIEAVKGFKTIREISRFNSPSESPSFNLI
jgi:hypothetical protein